MVPGTLFHQIVGAREFELRQFEIRGIAFQQLLRGRAVLLGRRELTFLHLQRRLSDGYLLTVIRIIDAGQQRAGLDPLAFVERQFHNAGLNGFEAENALVGFDIAGEKNRLVPGVGS